MDTDPISEDFWYHILSLIGGVVRNVLPQANQGSAPRISRWEEVDITKSELSALRACREIRAADQGLHIPFASHGAFLTNTPHIS